MPAAGGGDFRIGGREGEAGAGSAIGRGHEGGGTGPDPFWRWNDLVNGRQCRDAIHGLGLSQVDAEFEFIGHEFPGAPGDVGRHHGADCAPIWGEPGRVAASQSRIGRAANATRHVCADPGALGTAMGVMQPNELGGRVHPRSPTAALKKRGSRSHWPGSWCNDRRVWAVSGQGQDEHRQHDQHGVEGDLGSQGPVGADHVWDHPGSFEFGGDVGAGARHGDWA
jgi:hypothetical protein